MDASARLNGEVTLASATQALLQSQASTTASRI